MKNKYLIFLFIAVSFFTGKATFALSPGAEIQNQEQQLHQPTNQRIKLLNDLAFQYFKQLVFNKTIKYADEIATKTILTVKPRTKQQPEKQMDKALMLLGVGMITVFIILGLVVLIGNVLIAFVNRFVPEPVKTERQVRKSALQTQETITKKQIAAMVTAIDIVTKGKGKIVSITKESNKKK